MSRTMDLINGPIFDDMKRAAALSANSPWRAPIDRSARRTSSPLDIMRLMDRLNVANGSPYRNLPAEAAE